MDKIAVLIPCYNEEQTIGKVIEETKRVLPEAVIYVYDNNSTDRTAQAAGQAGAVVRREPLRRMFRETEALCYVMVDGDNTYSMEKAPEMVRLVLEGQADMVIGDRLSSTYFTENKRKFHNFGNTLVRGSINCLFQSRIKDVMTGFRCFSYEFVKTFPVLSKGFEIETEMTIHAVFNHLVVENVVIEYRDREEGSVSKLNTVSDGIRVLGMIFRMLRNYRPLLFFSLIGAVLFLGAALFMIPVLAEYFATGLVLKFPTLIVCGFMVLAAIQSLFTGLLLSVMLNKNKSDFEMRLTEASYRKRKKADL